MERGGRRKGGGGVHPAASPGHRPSGAETSVGTPGGGSQQIHAYPLSSPAQAAPSIMRQCARAACSGWLAAANARKRKTGGGRGRESLDEPGPRCSIVVWPLPASAGAARQRRHRRQAAPQSLRRGRRWGGKACICCVGGLCKRVAGGFRGVQRLVARDVPPTECLQ